jgi:hypothetical protein
MRWLLKRWYFWLGLFLFLGLGASAALIYSSQSRVNQENFDRLRSGMTIEEVEVILGKASARWDVAMGECASWCDGPSSIVLTFKRGELFEKHAYLESTWIHLRWHVRKAMEKIGIKWP